MIKKVEQDRQKCLFAWVTMFKLYVSGPSDQGGQRGVRDSQFQTKIEAKSSFFSVLTLLLASQKFWTDPTRFLDWPHQLFGPSAGPELVLLMLSTSKLNHQSDLERCHFKDLRVVFRV